MTDSDDERRRSRQTSRSVLGSAAIVVGAGLLAIAVANKTAGLSLPRFWYVNEHLWIFFGFALLPIGWALQKSSDRPLVDWAPSADGRRFHRLIVYTRPGCHLCDDALAQLGQYGSWLPPIEVIDIDEDPALLEAHGLEIPVVEIDGVVRFRGRVSEVLLRRLIEATEPG